VSEIDVTILEVFFQECEDLFGEIEESILAIENNPGDQDAVNNAFRAYHTVKGSSAMFGLSDLTDYTHHVESLLSDLRDGQIPITSELISTLLESLDCLKAFVGHYRDRTELDSQRIKESLQKVKRSGVSGEPVFPEANKIPAETDAESHQEVEQETIKINAGPQVHHYLIHARFQENLLGDGGDPISFIKEIGSLGKTVVIPHAHLIPSLDQIKPDTLYLQWTIRLETKKTLEEIDSVLMFFTADHDISIENIRKPPVETKAKAIINDPGSRDSSMDAISNPTVSKVDRPKPDPVRKPDKPPASSGASPPAKSSDSIRVSISKLDKLVNLVGEAVINQTRFVKTCDQVFSVDEQLGESLLQLLDDNDLIVREVQEQVLNIRMVPIQGVFSPLQRMVRSYSIESGKQIRIEISGGDTELDKTLTEKLSGPIKHLIRNAMDHGIESPEVRSQAEKETAGLISVNAFQEEGHIVIEIGDDGKGIHPEKILESARSKGLIGVEDNPTIQEIYQLLFSPGFSTADNVTDVSGRGVGMDVVKRDIESLHGSVAIRSEPGKGTLFRIKLPLTLAIIEGMLIRVGNEVFTIPLLSIIESLRPRQKQVKTVKKQGEVIDVRGEYIPIIRLHEVFDLTPRFTDPEDALVIIVENFGDKHGLLVDDIEEQQQIVIKSLEDNFVQLPGVAGATILGDGNISLILEIAGLIKLSQEAEQNKKDVKSA
jgi:two-component system, chemotaxis family, sensor kinase CheA